MRDPAKPKSAKTFHFVLDQSEAQAAADAKLKKGGGQGEKLIDKAADKTAKPGVKPGQTPPPNPPMALAYDRLIFDADGDADLTNDPAVDLMKSKPGYLAGYRVFNPISVSLGEGSDARQHPVRLLPCFQPNAGGGQILFMPATVREGEIKVGQQAYIAMTVQPLRMASIAARPPAAKAPAVDKKGKVAKGQSPPQPAPRIFGVVGRFDKPTTALFLTPVGSVLPPTSPYFPDRMDTIREADGEYYQFLASPAGDQLTVRPCPGERCV